MKTHQQSFQERLIAAVGCAREEYERIDWTRPDEAVKFIHPQAFARVHLLYGQDLIEREPPGPSVAWWAVANAEAELGDIDGAIESCRRGIKLNERRPGVKDLRKLLERLEQQRDPRRAQAFGGQIQ